MGLLHLRLRLVGALLLLLVLGLAGAAFTCDGGARTLADGQMNDNFCDCEVRRSADPRPMRAWA